MLTNLFARATRTKFGGRGGVTRVLLAFSFTLMGLLPTSAWGQVAPPPLPDLPGQPNFSPLISPTPTPTILPVPVCAAPFTDVHPTDSFYEPVNALYCRGVISGYSDNTFRPYASATRAQFVKIVVLALSLGRSVPAGGAYSFADVQPTFPFFDFIETAAAHGLVLGYQCGGAGEPCDMLRRPYFRPYVNISRGQAIRILVSAKGWPLRNPATPSFADVLPGSAFYQAIETAYSKGTVVGYGCGLPGELCDAQQRPYFRAYTDATRGQVARFVYLAL